jgi:hypothetical protein
MVVGGALEGAQRYGEGQGAVSGFASGAALTGGANVATRLGMKTANALGKRAGIPGRWEDPAEEYIDTFAKQQGVDLRLGDLPGHRMARSVENAHLGAVGRGGMERQAAQLEGAVFGGGNKLFAGFDIADKAMRDKSVTAWRGVNQLAQQGTTKVAPTELRAEMAAATSMFPKLAKGIRNQETKQLMDDLLTGSPMKNFTFEEVRSMQRSLGDEVARLHRRGKIGDDERNAANRVYAAISRDLDSWGQHPRNQPAYDAYRTVNEWYKKEVLPFEQNDIISRWRDGDYRGHNEKLISDIVNPANKTQVEQLKWYLANVGHQSAHDATGLLEVLQRADRGATVLAKGTPDSNLNISPLGLGLQVTKAAAGSQAQRPAVKAIGAAAARPRIFNGPIGEAAERRVMMAPVGGLGLMGEGRSVGWKETR